MKIKRYKKVSKILNFYINYFKFREPYQILVDGTFCYTALNNKINIEDNIPRYLQSEIKFLTTQCVSIETEKLGRKVSGALIILKKFPLHKCGHEGKPIPGADCLFSMVEEQNKNHYIIATQDLDLQMKVRQTVGVPLLYLHQKTPVLEHQSEVSIRHSQSISSFGKLEKETIAELKEKHGLVEKEDTPKKRKRKGGPNPLSCKKKKKSTGVTATIQKQSLKKDTENNRRKKLRIPKHIKDELLKRTNKI